ncbi:EAL domain-containing protein [Photobacterium minamisatsumaniensis]|uniref:putative bifunctional diguanylate cyclase/phosphodiesterase n=1 Tax=Photobacterium minamisatsumaniensis TaxID=2910233 RepID=UPI003D0EB768
MKIALLRFLALLIPLLSITTAATFYIYNEDIQQLKQRIQERERSTHQASLHITRLHFSPIIDDLRYLTAKAKEIAETGVPLDTQKNTLTTTFKRLSSTRRYYDQVRLINENGMEVIRVNQLGDQTVSITNDQLQDKSQRTYVKKALEIPPGSFYTSQFDLNIENGQVELPQKPMLRFVSHFKVNGKSWLISLNYLGKDYLSELNRQYHWNDAQSWLINSNGQWLLGPEKDSEWQFMPSYSESNQPDFYQQHPALWNEILETQSGQAVYGDYLYTYTRFFSGNTFSGEETFTLPFSGTDLPWTIISRVNMTNAVVELAFTQQRIFKFVIFSIMIMALVSGCIVLSWHLLQMLHAQRKLNLEIKDVALKYSTVLKHVPDGLLTIDEEMNLITINHAARHILNLPDKDITGRNLLKLVRGFQARKQIEQLVNAIHEQPMKSDRSIKSRIQLKNIKTKHIEIIAIETSYSSSSEILLNLRDVTYWIEREEKLKSMSRALEQSTDAILITNNRGIIEYVNQSFEKHNGVTSHGIVGTQSNVLLRQSLTSDREVIDVQTQLKEGKTIQRMIAHRKLNDDIVYEEKTISPIRNSRGKISHYISTGKDITDRVLFESRLHKLAHYDLLTELPNKTLLQQKIDALALSDKSAPCIALMSLDIDHFKQVNDSLGHDTGDNVIKTVARRLQHAIREHDFLARLAGDKFGVLISKTVDPTIIANLATRINRQLSYPIMIDGNELFLTVSIGISLLPDDTTQPENLSKYADIALYRAKDTGRNRFCFYTHEMGKESIKQLQLESELRKTVGSDRYELYYQPKVYSITHDICGVEALLRWKNEEGQVQPPMTVIPILERSGLIIEVGEQLILQACSQLRAWQDQGVFLNFALNISARQLLNSNLVEATQKAIIQTGCDPKHLEFEITETVIMSDVETALDRLVKLEALGIQIAIDDFGTGYSSLAYLSRFPIHILKVDREFVKDLPWHKDNITITRSIVELAHNLNMRVVAEGVESDSQEAFLASLGVEEFQGFYFSKPLPIDDFERLYIYASDEEILTNNI